MIIVTGATGQLGRAIVEALVKRVSPSQVGASVRNPSKAADLAGLGVRVRQGDFENRADLVQAFEGAEQVLLVSSNARSYGGDPLAQHRTAIDAAIGAGVARVVYTSHMAVSSASAFPPMHDHFATEAMLAESGLAWTALRNGFYAASGLAMMGDASTTGLLEAPVDGKVSWTAHADLAEAAAIILTGPGHDGPTPPLTAAESFDFADLAAMTAKVSGTPIRREFITDETLIANMTARGVPESAQKTVLGLYIASRNSEFSLVDPTLERILGRPTTSVSDLIAQRIAASAVAGP
jgi:NAD(P)H dehydrogenase (quinone)